ncbi:MAG: TolC family protein [Planctomycetaceae bacterium]
MITLRPVHAFLSALALSGLCSTVQGQPAPLEQAPPLIRVTGDDGLYNELLNAAESVELETEAAQEFPVAVDAGWWQPLVPRSLRHDAPDVSISLEQTLYDAMAYSEQVKVFHQLPPIRHSAVIEADAAFDWHAFVDTQWDDLSDPIGNSLTVGPGINRFQDHNLYGSAGVRKRTRTGGQFEVSQRLGWQETNSQFFVPNSQGTSRIALSFTQPLLRGSGEWYNNSLICLAQIDHEVSQDEVMRQLQKHLLEVSRAYWALYLERGVLLQKLRTYQRAKLIVDRLRLRQQIDAPKSQIQAAEASLADRRSDLARAKTAVENAEDRLRTLVNHPGYGDNQSIELVPVDSPSFDIFPADMQTSLTEALQNRPEISQAIQQTRAASIRMGMAKEEMLPVLNLVTSSYIAGLAANGDVAKSWGNQFSQGRPGYSIGLQFEVPISNRAARARHDRRQFELQQLQHQYQVTMKTVSLEVQVAVREIETSMRELFSKQQVVNARDSQLEQLVKRWERLPNGDTTTNLILDNILRAQEDLGRAEFEYLQAQITYNLAQVNLKQATGTLLQYQSVNTGLSTAPVVANEPEIQSLSAQAP